MQREAKEPSGWPSARRELERLAAPAAVLSRDSRRILAANQAFEAIAGRAGLDLSGLTPGDLGLEVVLSPIVFERGPALLALALSPAWQAEMGRRVVAEDALEAIQRVARGACHEITNPLTTVQGLASLLERQSSRQGDLQAGNESLREDARAIVEETERAATVIRSLRTLMGAGAPPPASLRQTVDLVCTLRSWETRTRGIGLDTDVDPCLDHVPAFPQLLLHLTLRMVLWAEDVMASTLARPDARRSAALPPLITVSTLGTAEGAYLTVSQNIAGFVDDDLDLSFSPLPAELLPDCPTRLPLFAPPEPGGLNAGLFVVRLLAERMGGSVSAKALPGQGVLLQALLPVA